MTKQDLHELVWNYLFDKAYDEDKLFEEIEYLLKSFDQWCGYTSQEIWEYWNDNKKRYEFGDEFIPFLINHITLDNKTYDVDGIKITPTLKKQLFVFKNKLEEKEAL
tara:strand:- start:116 stop:436 length:321 start_codon:yes stop_codon:yes gene_type:complete